MMSENIYFERLKYSIEQKAKRDNQLRQLERVANAQGQFERIRMMEMVKNGGKR
jgi:hypothetical protein